MDKGQEGIEWAAVARTSDRLNDASVLIEYARLEPDAAKASLFCGCACMVLVIALEEETSLVVRAAAEEKRRAIAVVPGTIGATGLEELRGATLPKRVLELPRLMSRGRLVMRPSGVHVRALWELLRVRNLLAHKTPDTVLERSPEEDSTWVKQFLAVLGADPWRRVSLDSVESHYEAVRCYVNELQEIELDDEGTYQGGAMTGLALV